MVYHGLSQLNPDENDPLWQHWTNRAQMLLTQSIVQLTHRDEIFAALTDAGLDLLPVKGSWLKEQYPQIDFRQMADLDVLIRRENRAKVREIMLSLGFTPEKIEMAAHHDGYEKKPYTAIEIHLQLLPLHDKNGGYYNDPWKKAIPMEENPGIYRFSPEDEYIFYFLHLNHHLDENSCGIRSVLDNRVYRDNYPTMNRAYLQQEFQQLGIWELVQNVETLADCWFGTGEKIPKDLQAMAECILRSGSYGTLEDLVHRRVEQLNKKYKNPAVRMAVYWTSRFCRPMDEMKHNYPILEKLPILLPVCWVVRILKKLVQKPRDLLYHVQEIYRGTKHG